MLVKEIFKPNTQEHHVWMYHHDGKSIPEIAVTMKMTYDQVKEIVLRGWRLQG